MGQVAAREVEGRPPTDQAFDEWWGYKNSANEADWTSYAAMRALAKENRIHGPLIWEGQQAEKSTPGA